MKLSQRPENFTINSNHSLLNGLIWAGLGSSKGSNKFVDSSPRCANGSLVNCIPSQDWKYDNWLNRFCVSLTSASTKYINGPTYTGAPTQFSFSVWSYRTVAASWSSPLNSEDINADRNGFSLYFQSDQIVVETCTAAAFTYYMCGASSSTRNVWEHYIVTFNNGYLYVYLNGKIATATGGATQGTFLNPVLGTYPFRCGADGPLNFSSLYTGLIADPMVWIGRTLGKNEIDILSDPSNSMLSGLIQYPKRKSFLGYTLPTSPIVENVTIVKRAGTKLTKRPDNFVINQDHYLANGLIFAGCGKSPGATTYVDSSIYQTNGILTTMTPTIDWVWDDKIGQWVLEFDGSDDYVRVESIPSFRLAGNKSLCCWVKMPTLSTGCGFTGKSNSTVYGMALGYGWNGNGFMALCWNSTNNPWIARDATRDYEWCHLTAVQHGTTRYIYVWDSQGLRTSSWTTGTHSWDHADPFRIGDAGAQKPPNGTKIGSVLVYNRALSAAETKVLANPYDPMMDGLLRVPKRKYYTAPYSEPLTPTAPRTNYAIVKARPVRKLTERPETFTLDYNNRLADGLVFASLGNSAGSNYSSDSSLYNTPGSLVGMSPSKIQWSAQINRKFFAFAGTTGVPQYSAHPARSQYNLVKQGTIAFWAKAELLDNSLQDCIIKGGAAWAVNDWSVWFSSNQFGGNIANGTSALSTSGPRTPTITDSTKFNHVCFTWYFNGTQSVTKMYFNGILNQTVNTAIIPQDRIYTFGIARDNEYNGYYFVGGMADIMLYNRDLTALEVNQIGDISNVMLSSMIQSPKRKYFPAYSDPLPAPLPPPVKRFLRLSTNSGRSLFLWK